MGLGREEVGRHWEEGRGWSLGKPQGERQGSEASGEWAELRVILYFGKI